MPLSGKWSDQSIKQAILFSIVKDFNITTTTVISHYRHVRCVFQTISMFLNCEIVNTGTNEDVFSYSFPHRETPSYTEYVQYIYVGHLGPQTTVVVYWNGPGAVLYNRKNTVKWYNSTIYKGCKWLVLLNLSRSTLKQCHCMTHCMFTMCTMCDVHSGSSL